ncbi:MULTISPECIES: DUF5872 domain-containing protein [unclassified Saccharopolyspora]|uniref:DUF5872 domain-containing protein n=2 Tax=Saccharopolyspora TaxID=1835 RepID=UPI001CD25A64|nr:MULTISPECIES: DUF5872 domain-containing protein [unclassified Saccharopolyspora]MCA1195014.1 hypothetical protein [Saccharopolyspora sp. 6V]MCA1228565.1 hypothetical protein [Saccharopolyspora sp. 6M]MCA1282594.1 hypothetical protein [Saccharopolyspora sp. 7B]
MGKSSADYERDYTDPRLRERLKDELKDSDDGGAPGQWSARKSQLLAQRYEQHGGGYRHPRRRTRAQRDLQRWTEERWQTESGSARARHDGTTERYLPEAAWEELTPRERRETRRAKREASRRGAQHAANPPAAKSARRSAELDELPAREAARRARELPPREAAAAARHEREHKARKTVLRELDRT